MAVIETEATNQGNKVSVKAANKDSNFFENNCIICKHHVCWVFAVFLSYFNKVSIVGNKDSSC